MEGRGRSGKARPDGRPWKVREGEARWKAVDGSSASTSCAGCELSGDQQRSVEISGDQRRSAEIAPRAGWPRGASTCLIWASRPCQACQPGGSLRGACAAAPSSCAPASRSNPKPNDPRSTQKPSEAIRSHPKPSEALRSTPKPSEAIQSHPKPSEATRITPHLEARPDVLHARHFEPERVQPLCDASRQPRGRGGGVLPPPPQLRCREDRIGRGDEGRGRKEIVRDRGRSWEMMGDRDLRCREDRSARRPALRAEPVGAERRAPDVRTAETERSEAIRSDQKRPDAIRRDQKRPEGAPVLVPAEREP